ncbi:MAG: 6-phosphofructokinase [Oscillospiraceae bacterium]|jgi:6-phosphofructokinase
MNELKGACVIGQSGGPTAVINASAAGAIEAALKSSSITNVYAMEHGIQGMLADRLFDCGKEDPEQIKLLRTTPASALGSCRYKLKDPKEDDTDYKKILEVFKKHDIRYFFYNGGNDSMDTCNKVSKYMAESGWECRVIGIPKTIDNDLAGTDHCPGYGSAAKYISTSVAEISRDNAVYDMGSIVIVEIMGRNAGWLTAASALGNKYGCGADLVYIPEIDFDLDAFIAKIQDMVKTKPSLIIGVSEGVHDKDGKFISEYGSDLAKQKDVFGHSQMGGLAATLAGIVKSRTGLKTRGIELSLLQRCAAHCASKADVDEAYMAGAAAVEAAVSGVTDKMVGFERPESGPYVCRSVLLPLDVVANAEKKIPRDWMNEEGCMVNDKFYDYALPLINGESSEPYKDGIPQFAHLKKVFVD